MRHNAPDRITVTAIKNFCHASTADSLFRRRAIKSIMKYRIATDTATTAGKYNDTPALNASRHWAAGRELCRGEIPVMLAATDSLTIALYWGKSGTNANISLFIYFYR